MARRRRYELTDQQFKRIEEALLEGDGRDRPYEYHRKVVSGIFWVLRSGPHGGIFRNVMGHGKGL
ncbi:transposase [Salinibacter ruber]|nr:transposase [Salinibacter ruber]